MRWRRAAVFAAIVVAHFLVVWLFPSGNGPHESAEPEISFATLVAPERNAEQAPRAEHARRAVRGTQASRIRRAKTGAAAASPPELDQQPGSVPAFIDWTQEAQIAADNRIKSDAAASSRVRALSAWKSRVMPPSAVPAAPKFSWDYAATHRLESSALGLTVNLNDRCSLLISLYLMAIMGGCKVGELPVHADLFSHMRDEPGLLNQRPQRVLGERLDEK